ncbi:MAG: hypothetical protein R3F48_09860 [Candidatus Zixiibacteriota bacterium]
MDTNTHSDSQETTEQTGHAKPVSVPFIFQSTRRLGITLNQDSVAFCLVYSRFGKPVIADIHDEKFKADEIPEPGKYLDAAIGKILGYITRNKLRGIPINIGILWHEIAFRRMYLPAMPKSELREAVRWDSEKLFPFPFSKSAMHFEIVEKVTRGESKKFGINIIAAKLVMIEEIYSKFASVGLTIGQLNYLPSLLTNLLPRQKDSDADNRQIIIHLDDRRRSMAAFANNGYLEFFQEFVTPIVLNEENETGLADFSAIAAELQSFQDLYIAQSRASDVKEIIISGSPAKAPGLAAAFEAQTGIPCRSIYDFEPYRKLCATYSGDCSSVYLPVMMTAIASPNIKPLAPADVIAKIENKVFIYRVSAAAVLALLIVAGLQFIQVQRANSLEATLLAKTEEIQKLEQSPAYQGYLNLAGKLKRSQSYLALSQEKKDSHFHVILKALAQDVPSELNFSDLEFKNFDEGLQLRLMGHVRVDNFSPEIILAQYIETLRKIPFLQNVTVTNHHKQKKNDKFDLFFQIQMDTQV